MSILDEAAPGVLGTAAANVQAAQAAWHRLSTELHLDNTRVPTEDSIPLIITACHATNTLPGLILGSSLLQAALTQRVPNASAAGDIVMLSVRVLPMLLTMTDPSASSAAVLFARTMALAALLGWNVPGGVAQGPVRECCSLLARLAQHVEVPADAGVQAQLAVTVLSQAAETCTTAGNAISRMLPWHVERVLVKELGAAPAQALSHCIHASGHAWAGVPLSAWLTMTRQVLLLSTTVSTGRRRRIAGMVQDPAAPQHRAHTLHAGNQFAAAAAAGQAALTVLLRCSNISAADAAGCWRAASQTLMLLTVRNVHVAGDFLHTCGQALTATAQALARTRSALRDSAWTAGTERDRLPTLAQSESVHAASFHLLALAMRVSVIGRADAGSHALAAMAAFTLAVLQAWPVLTPAILATTLEAWELVVNQPLKDGVTPHLSVCSTVATQMKLGPAGASDEMGMYSELSSVLRILLSPYQVHSYIEAVAVCAAEALLLSGSLRPLCSELLHGDANRIAITPAVAAIARLVAQLALPLSASVPLHGANAEVGDSLTGARAYSPCVLLVRPTMSLLVQPRGEPGQLVEAVQQAAAAWTEASYVDVDALNHALGSLAISSAAEHDRLHALLGMHTSALEWLLRTASSAAAAAVPFAYDAAALITGHSSGMLGASHPAVIQAVTGATTREPQSLLTLALVSRGVVAAATALCSALLQSLTSMNQGESLLSRDEPDPRRAHPPKEARNPSEVSPSPLHTVQELVQSMGLHDPASPEASLIQESMDASSEDAGSSSDDDAPAELHAQRGSALIGRADVSLRPEVLRLSKSLLDMMLFSCAGTADISNSAAHSPHSLETVPRASPHRASSPPAAVVLGLSPEPSGFSSGQRVEPAVHDAGAAEDPTDMALDMLTASLSGLRVGEDNGMPALLQQPLEGADMEDEDMADDGPRGPVLTLVVHSAGSDSAREHTPARPRASSAPAAHRESMQAARSNVQAASALLFSAQSTVVPMDSGVEDVSLGMQSALSALLQLYAWLRASHERHVQRNHLASYFNRMSEQLKRHELMAGGRGGLISNPLFSPAVKAPASSTQPHLLDMLVRALGVSEPYHVLDVVLLKARHTLQSPHSEPESVASVATTLSQFIQDLAVGADSASPASLKALHPALTDLLGTKFAQGMVLDPVASLWRLHELELRTERADLVGSLLRVLFLHARVFKKPLDQGEDSSAAGSSSSTQANGGPQVRHAAPGGTPSQGRGTQRQRQEEVEHVLTRVLSDTVHTASIAAQHMQRAEYMETVAAAHPLRGSGTDNQLALPKAVPMRAGSVIWRAQSAVRDGALRSARVPGHAGIEVPLDADDSASAGAVPAFRYGRSASLVASRPNRAPPPPPPPLPRSSPTSPMRIAASPSHRRHSAMDIVQPNRMPDERRPNLSAITRAGNKSAVLQAIVAARAGGFVLAFLGRDWLSHWLTAFDAVGSAVHARVGCAAFSRPTGLLVRPAHEARPRLTVPRVRTPGVDGASLLARALRQGSATEEVLQSLRGSAHSSLSGADTAALCTWLNDVRGIVAACTNILEWTAVVDWLACRHLELAAHLVVVLVPGTQLDSLQQAAEVHTAVMKLLVELLRDSGGRARPPPQSPVLLTLWATAARVLVSVCSNWTQPTLHAQALGGAGHVHMVWEAAVQLQISVWSRLTSVAGMASGLHGELLHELAAAALTTCRLLAVDRIDSSELHTETGTCVALQLPALLEAVNASPARLLLLYAAATQGDTGVAAVQATFRTLLAVIEVLTSQDRPSLTAQGLSQQAAMRGERGSELRELLHTASSALGMLVILVATCEVLYVAGKLQASQPGLPASSYSFAPSSAAIFPVSDEQVRQVHAALGQLESVPARLAQAWLLQPAMLQLIEQCRELGVQALRADEQLCESVIVALLERVLRAEQDSALMNVLGEWLAACAVCALGSPQAAGRAAIALCRAEQVTQSWMQLLARMLDFAHQGIVSSALHVACKPFASRFGKDYDWGAEHVPLLPHDRGLIQHAEQSFLEQMCAMSQCNELFDAAQGLVVQEEQL